MWKREHLFSVTVEWRIYKFWGGGGSFLHTWRALLCLPCPRPSKASRLPLWWAIICLCGYFWCSQQVTFCILQILVVIMNWEQCRLSTGWVGVWDHLFFKENGSAWHLRLPESSRDGETCYRQPQSTKGTRRNIASSIWRSEPLCRLGQLGSYMVLLLVIRSVHSPQISNSLFGAIFALKRKYWNHKKRMHAVWGPVTSYRAWPLFPLFVLLECRLPQLRLRSSASDQRGSDVSVFKNMSVGSKSLLSTNIVLYV